MEYHLMNYVEPPKYLGGYIIFGLVPLMINNLKLSFIKLDTSMQIPKSLTPLLLFNYFNITNLAHLTSSHKSCTLSGKMGKHQT